MKFGIQTAPMEYSWKHLRDVWRNAEQLGFDSAWVFDHLLALYIPDDSSILEAWTLLGALADVTDRMEIGCMVTGNTYRNPALLAKMAVTVDHVSNGRLTVGLGAGYHEPEHVAYGFDFFDGPTRAARLGEACQVILGLFEHERFSFVGEHYTLGDAPFFPPTVRRPHPPLLIGGRGERLTLRIAARYADKWNLAGGSTAEDFAKKYAVLKDRCDELGRDVAEIEPNMAVITFVDRNGKRALRRAHDLATRLRVDHNLVETAFIVGEPEAVAERISGLGEVGVQHFVLTLVDGANETDLELFAESVIAAVEPTAMHPPLDATPAHFPQEKLCE